MNVDAVMTPAVRVMPPPVAVSVTMFAGAVRLAPIEIAPVEDRVIAPDVVVIPVPTTLKLPVFENRIDPLVEFTIWRFPTWKPPAVRFTPSVETWLIRRVVEETVPLDRSTWPFDVVRTVSRPERLPLMVISPEVVVTVVISTALASPRIWKAFVKPTVTLPSPLLVDVKLVTPDRLPAGSDAPVAELTVRVVVVMVPPVRFTWPVVDVRMTL